MTQEQRKEQAIKYMTTLDIYKPYIKGFKENDQVCFYEQFAGFWVDQEPDVFKKMKEIEQEHNCTVYAITHEFLEFGECYSFLIVTDYEEEWDTLLEKYGREYAAFAYVWNKDVDWCSEFGTITVQSFGGGIRRVG